MPLVRYIKAFFLLMAGFLLFATLAWRLPDGPIRQHVNTTLLRTDLCQMYPEALAPELQCRQDNFTDALILNQCCCNNRNSWSQSVLLLPSAYPAGSKFPKDGLDYLAAGGSAAAAPVVYHYPRYWHGSTFLMRFLLLCAPYSNLRFVLLALSAFLLMLLGARLYLLRGWMPVAALAVAFALVRGPVMQCSIQFFPVLFIALLAAWMMCNGRQRWRSPAQAVFLLFVAGALTAYFDLLTAPVLTLGLPLCVLLLLRRNEAVSLCHELWLTVRGALLWAAGYGLTWVSKWLLASCLTPMDVWADGMGQFAYRSAGLPEASRWEALLANTNLIAWPWALTLLLALVLFLAVHLLRHPHSATTPRQSLRTALPLLLVALLPLAWYLVVANHSYLHNWFTYRSLWVLLVALFFVPLQFLPPSSPTHHNCT